MNEIFFVVLSVVVAAGLAVILSIKSSAAYRKDVQRRLVRVENQLLLTSNLLAMSQLTTQGEADRVAYICLAEAELSYTLDKIHTLQKEMH